MNGYLPLLSTLLRLPKSISPRVTFGAESESEQDGDNSDLQNMALHSSSSSLQDRHSESRG